MEITEVKVYLVDQEKLRAFVSIVLDRCFMINDIKVIRGTESHFVSMPSRRKRNGQFKDVAHPLNQETRQWLEGKILGEYEAALARQADELEDERPELAANGRLAPGSMHAVSTNGKLATEALRPTRVSGLPDSSNGDSPDSTAHRASTSREQDEATLEGGCDGAGDSDLDKVQRNLGDAFWS